MIRFRHTGDLKKTTKFLKNASIMSYSERNIYYNGDSDVGMTITLHASGDIENVLILNSITGESMRILTDRIAAITGTEGCGFKAQDSIRVCTAKGKKSITLLRNGITYNILNALDRQSKWFTLAKGDNTFAFSADSGFTNMSIIVENAIVYEGM